MRASLIVLVLATVPWGALAQSDQDWRLCRAVDADHLVIPACTRLIEAGNLAARNPAIASAPRGAAHGRQRNFNDAIADKNEAIKIAPTLAPAYAGRGAAYSNKGEDDQ